MPPSPATVQNASEPEEDEAILESASPDSQPENANEEELLSGDIKDKTIEDQATALSEKDVVASLGEILEAEFGPIDKERLIQIIQSETHAGPLPPPQTMVQYEKAQPGLINVITGRWVKQSDHRMWVEKLMAAGSLFRELLRLLIGGGIGVTCLYFGYTCAMAGHTTAAVTFIGVVVALVGVFVIGEYLGTAKKKKAKEEEEDDE